MSGFVVIIALTANWYVTFIAALLAAGLIYWKLQSYLVIELHENTIRFKRGFAFLSRTMEVKYEEIKKVEVTQLPRGFCKVSFFVSKSNDTYTLMYQHWQPKMALEWVSSKGAPVVQ